MEIKTNEEPLRYLGIDYHIDIENKLAFPPYVINHARDSYDALIRRKKIRPETIQKPGMLSRFLNYLKRDQGHPFWV